MTDRHSIDIDNISRDKIRNDVEHNYFVEAGAGSGKTTVLVDRMVSMVEAGIDISKVCAITFTKAAAGEFYERFQAKLAKLDSERARAALQNIDLCFMGTIDSFCNMILSEHPAAAGIPSNAAVVGDAGMDAMLRMLYSDILSGATGNAALEAKGREFSRLFYNAEGQFIKGMKTLLECKGAHVNYTAPADVTYDDFFGQDRLDLIEVIKFLYKNQNILSTGSAAARDAVNTLNRRYNLLTGSWNNVLSEVHRALKGLSSLSIPASYREMVEDLCPGWERYFVMPTGRGRLIKLNIEDDALMYEHIDEYRMPIAMDFLIPCRDMIEAKMRAEGRLTYTDYLIYLRDMLARDAAEDGGLIRHIFDRHSYYLIDESQDTNPVQSEIFFYLTAKQPVADWTKCKPRPGSLFIVGDPKQSIYRFRNADIPSYIRVRELFEDPEIGEVLYLTRNFRSSDNLCRWFNDVFSDMMPEDNDNQCRFTEIPVGDKPEYQGTLEGAYSYQVTKADIVPEPERLAELITALVDNPAHTISGTGEGGIARMIRYDDIMIIARNKSSQAALMRAMNECSIPYRVEGSVLFGDCRPLQSLSYVMSAVADPHDKKALFAACSLSGLGLTEEEIRDMAYQFREMTAAAVFGRLIDDAKLLVTAGTDNIEYLYYALELLRSVEADGTVMSLKEGAEYIQGLIQGITDVERCAQLNQDNNRVHIANLHKVKGLQAPVVILMSPVMRKHEPAKRISYQDHGAPEAYIFAIGDNLRTNGYYKERMLEAAALEAEHDRLNYVAATRAECVLIVSGMYVKDKKSKGYVFGENNAWAQLYMKAERDIFEEVGKVDVMRDTGDDELDAEAVFDSGKETCLSFEELKAPTYRILRPSSIAAEIEESAGGEPDAETAGTALVAGKIPETDTDDTTKGHIKIDPTLTGTIVHRVMELLVSSRNTIDRNDLVSEIVREYISNSDYEKYVPYYTKMLNGVVDTMRSGGYAQSYSGTPEWMENDLLTALVQAEEVYCEVPFCYVDGEDDSAIWNGIMDVIVKHDGKWYIIDYKTNAIADGLEEHYKEQLSAYTAAFKIMTGEEAVSLIYHIQV